MTRQRAMPHAAAPSPAGKTRAGAKARPACSPMRRQMPARVLACMLALICVSSPAFSQPGAAPPIASQTLSTGPTFTAPTPAPGTPTASSPGQVGQEVLSPQPPAALLPESGTPVSGMAVSEDTSHTTPAPDTAVGIVSVPPHVQAPAQSIDPAPSFLEDPAQAFSRMLATSERRADLPHDLSPWGMFLAADWVVKAVMIGLAFASVVTWTVWFAKSLEIAGAGARVRRALRVIGSAGSLAQAAQALTGRSGPAAHMVRAAEEEMRRSIPALDHAGGAGVKERVTSSLLRIEVGAGRKLMRGTGVLATIGATAPFVGLFGTVWGIMNSFIGISQAQTTNLAIVAPGIAEALLATAIGLVAAIPAVIVYNLFARSIAGYRQALADAAAGIERLVSLDLDFRMVPANDDAALRQAAE